MNLTRDEAYNIYTILVEECGALEREREHFVYVQTDGDVPEYRFQGDLGFGGKFWRNNGRWYVNCYPENETHERFMMIRRANIRLANLRSKATKKR